MELLNNLASVGLTTKVLQFIIVGGILAFIVGVFWRIIVIGAGIIACLFIFLAPSQSATIASNNEVINPADVAPIEFVEDCLKYNEGATKISCQKMWKEDGNGKE
jgi:hypothetical protein